MLCKPQCDPDVAGAMEREAPLHSKYKEVEPDLSLHPGKSMRESLLPGGEDIPPVYPGRGDAAEMEAGLLVSATSQQHPAHGLGRPFEKLQKSEIPAPASLHDPSLQTRCGHYPRSSRQTR